MTTRESTSGNAEYVVDADGHLCEPADLWERNLPASMRDRGIRLRWNEATGFDAHERVKVLDSEGIDVSVMYPGLGLKLGGITDARLAVESCAVYNDWVADWCSAAPDRLKGVGALPMQDPDEAGREAYRIRDRGLVAGFARPNAYNNRPFHDPSYTPVWEALEATGLALGLHITGLADMPGAARGMGHLMAPGTQHAMIPVLDQMVTLSNLV